VVSTIFAAILGLVQMPQGGLVSTPPDISPIFLKFEWRHIFTLDMLIVVFTFLFVNLFDTIGTLLGVASKAGILDENGTFPQIKKALFADALGTTFGAVLGTSTVTSYVESASGVCIGRKNGTYVGIYGCHVCYSSVFGSAVSDDSCFGYCSCTHIGGFVYDYVGSKYQFWRFLGIYSGIPYHRDDAFCV